MRALLALAAVTLLAGCAAPAPAPEVIATFYPLAWLSERIIPNVGIETLVPAGVEPHDWEPVPKDVARMGKATLLVQQGAGFESWFDRIASNLPRPGPVRVVTTEGLPMPEGLDEETGEMAPDPHTWLDPVLFARQAGLIEDAAALAFPDRAAQINKAANDTRAELAALDEAFMTGLTNCDVRIIIANHDAYSYMGRRYNVSVVTLSGLAPGSEPSPDTIAAAIDVAREHNITTIFFEELVSPRVAEVVAREVGAQTRVLSPIESAPASGDYLSLMRENLLGLREAMRCT